MADQTSSLGCHTFSSQGCSSEKKELLETLNHGRLLAKSLKDQLGRGEIVRIGPLYRDFKASRILLDNEYGDGKDFYMLLKYGTNKDVKNERWGNAILHVAKDEFTDCNLNKYEESLSQEKHKEAVERVSFFSIRKLMSKDGFDGKDTIYEHSDETGSKQMPCIGKNMTKKLLFDADGGRFKLGTFYPRIVEVLDVNDDWGGKMSSQPQDRSTGCNLNKSGVPFSPDKRKKTVQRLLSYLITTIVFLWIIFDTCTHSSINQLQPMHKQHGLVFIWSSFLEPFSFMVFIWAIVATIVVGAPFSRMQSAMLMIWAILMLLRSAKSINEVYVPIMGILFTGCYVLVEKQPELPN